MTHPDARERPDGAGGKAVLPVNLYRLLVENDASQIVLLRDRGETAAYVADLIPTIAHLPLPWIMEQLYVLGWGLIARMRVNFVEEPETTTILPDGSTAVVDERWNLVITP